MMLFILPIAVLAVIFEVALRNIPNNYSYKNNYLDKNSKDIQVLILGSSHSFAGIDPTYLSFNSFNAAESSQTLEFDYQIFKKYDDKWNNLKYIILPVDYFSFTSNLSASIESWRIRYYELYYKINITGNILNTFQVSSNLRVNLQKLRDFNFKNKSNITCSALGRDLSYNSGRKRDLYSTAIAAAHQHRAINNQYLKENIIALQSIIKLAAKHNVKVILYMSPAYKTYVQQLNRQQLDNVINVTKNIASANRNAMYVNLLNDSTFKKVDFFDADHLNEIGAKKLTKKIDSLVKLIEYKNCK